MDGYLRVAGSDEIPEGEARSFEVGGTFIAVARTGRGLYAFDDECTHDECPLSFGFIKEREIECDCHGAMFDMATGEVTKPPAVTPIRVYPVREDGGEVLVQVQA